MSRAKMSRVHWSIIGYDENGDQDGELCRCEIGESHAAGVEASADTKTLRRVRGLAEVWEQSSGYRRTADLGALLLAALEGDQ